MTIIHKADKRKGAAPARAVAPEMDRTVANCLCCGKVYDCRESSSDDVKSFVGEHSSALRPHLQAGHALVAVSLSPDVWAVKVCLDSLYDQ